MWCTISLHESSKYKTIWTSFPHAKVFPFLIKFSKISTDEGHLTLAGLSTIGLISNTFWVCCFCKLLSFVAAQPFLYCSGWPPTRCSSICEWWWFIFLKLLIQSLKHSIYLGMFADSRAIYDLCAASWLVCSFMTYVCNFTFDILVIGFFPKDPKLNSGYYYHCVNKYVCMLWPRKNNSTHPNQTMVIFIPMWKHSLG